MEHSVTHRRWRCNWLSFVNVLARFKGYDWSDYRSNYKRQKIYCIFVKRGITIKMPDSVPPGVSNSFIAIVPAAVIITISCILYGILKTFNTTFLDIIYKTIQTPLQGL